MYILCYHVLGKKADVDWLSRDLTLDDVWLVWSNNRLVEIRKECCIRSVINVRSVANKVVQFYALINQL